MPDFRPLKEVVEEKRNRAIAQAKKQYPRQDLQVKSVKGLAQQKFCQDNEIPMFAPISGRCHNPGCMADVYEKLTVEQAGEQHVTRCWSCGKSFCS